MPNDVAPRPWTPLEVTAAKNKLLAEYLDPRNKAVNDDYVMQMFSAQLHNTPDEEKTLLLGDLSNVQAKMQLNEDLDRIVGQYGMNVPLGGVSKGMKLERDMRFKDVLDTTVTGVTGGGVLARVDLVPQINVWMVTEFPGLARFQRIPSNGLNHVWNNLIDLGDATDGFMDEFGCPPANHGTYFQGMTNIAIIALERGTSLKLEFAVRQSGMLYDGNMTTGDLEMRNMTWARSRIVQRCVYQGTTASGHTGTDEYGTTFTNGFNGLRVLISANANTVHANFYPTGFGPVIGEVSGGGSILDQINSVCGTIYDNGGRPTAIHLSQTAARKLFMEQEQFIRIPLTDANGGIIVGGTVEAVATVVGVLPVVVVPGGAIGKYAAPAGSALVGGNCEDIYILDERYIQMPYLGTPDPLPIEIPLGVPDASGHGCLLRKFIIYWMVGFAVTVPIFQGKVRIAAT